MVAVHFKAIPCELSATNRHIESHIFDEIRRCTDTLAYASRFEVFKTVLCISCERFMLRIMGKCTSHHLFRYGGSYSFVPVVFGGHNLLLVGTRLTPIP